MKLVMTGCAAVVLVLCVFHETIFSVFGVSSLFLIGVLACAFVATIWLLPVIAHRRGGEWRYENRLLRRPAT